MTANTAAPGRKLTAEQHRVLRFLDEVARGQWVHLLEIERVVFLVEDDDLFVPSLAAHGLIEMGPPEIAVCRITPAGRAFLASTPSGDRHD